MVGTALTIEREIEDARSTRDTSVSSKRKEMGRWCATIANNPDI